LRDTVERAWHALGGPAAAGSERELDEALAYLDALGDVEARASGAPVDLALLTEALHVLYGKTRPRPETRVELLTIHKAKGLQFDTVIVPGLDRYGRSDPPPLLRWLKVPGQGGQRLIIAPMPASGVADRNPLHDWLGAVEDERLRQEKRRLLYVAATRAERTLHLLGTCEVETDPASHAQALRAPDADCALGLLWAVPDVKAAFEARLAATAAPEAEPGVQVPRAPVVVRVPDGWVPPPVPAAPPIVVRPLGRSIAANLVEFDWATETARHVGTVVHRELQRLARGAHTSPDGAQAQSALTGRPQEPQQLLARYTVELAELGVPHDRRQAAAQRVLEAVQRTVADERGRWLLQAPHREAQSEFGLTGCLGRDVVSVVIDRTFVEASSGVRWIVDYKTSLHEGAGLDAFLDNERERYRPQLERYAALVRPLGEEPIRLGLYFPLLSAWREWEAGADSV
jgi:ATP-dependent helicase/nuclease subunit A